MRLVAGLGRGSRPAELLEGGEIDLDLDTRDVELPGASAGT